MKTLTIMAWVPIIGMPFALLMLHAWSKQRCRWNGVYHGAMLAIFLHTI